MSALLPSAYAVPGQGLFPEGLAYDEQTRTLFTTSLLQGAVFRAPLDRPAFEVMSTAGAHGCTSSTGLRVNPLSRRLIVCGGVTGLAFVFNVDTGALLGRYANGLVTEVPGTMAPNAEAPRRRGAEFRQRRRLPRGRPSLCHMRVRIALLHCRRRVEDSSM